jgi:hypothetical protein
MLTAARKLNRKNILSKYRDQVEVHLFVVVAHQ